MILSLKYEPLVSANRINAGSLNTSPSTIGWPNRKPHLKLTALVQPVLLCASSRTNSNSSEYQFEYIIQHSLKDEQLIHSYKPCICLFGRFAGPLIKCLAIVAVYTALLQDTRLTPHSNDLILQTCLFPPVCMEQDRNLM